METIISWNCLHFDLLGSSDVKKRYLSLSPREEEPLVFVAAPAKGGVIVSGGGYLTGVRKRLSDMKKSNPDVKKCYCPEFYATEGGGIDLRGVYCLHVGVNEATPSVWPREDLRESR